MLHPIAPRLTIVLGLTAFANAQSWSITASVPSQGTATATFFTFTQPTQTTTTTLPPGPIAMGATFVNSGSFFSSQGWSSSDSQASWQQTSIAPSPFSFEVRSNAFQHGAVNPYSAMVGVTDLDATVDLTLACSVPVGGRLLIDWQGVAGGTSVGGTAQIDIDLGADGSNEVLAEPTGGPWQQAEFPLHLDPTGTVVRVRCRNHAAGGGTTGGTAMLESSSADLTLRARFLPNEPAVQSFDATGATASLAATHSLANAVTLTLDFQSQQVPGLLVFGQVPVVNPISPTITQLVDIDTLFPLTAMTLAMPNLPPGIALYCQGLVIDGSGTLRSSNSVRALWP